MIDDDAHFPSFTAVTQMQQQVEQAQTENKGVEELWTNLYLVKSFAMGL